MCLMSAFAPGRWGWSVAWLFVAHLFGWYLITKNRRSRIGKGERLAHLMPLPTVDSDLRMPIALELKLKKATLLAAALEEGGFADPYVVVTLSVPGKEPDKRETSPKFKTKNPVWDEKFKFEVAEVNLVKFVEITFELMDKDTLTKDDQIGLVRESLSRSTRLHYCCSTCCDEYFHQSLSTYETWPTSLEA